MPNVTPKKDMRLAAIQWNNKNSNKPSPTRKRKTNCEVWREIKEDMQKDKPMDRLLVGDVGYGKTEVAMRAVFKAVMDGKQAAILDTNNDSCRATLWEFRTTLLGLSIYHRIIKPFPQ